MKTQASAVTHVEKPFPISDTVILEADKMLEARSAPGRFEAFPHKEGDYEIDLWLLNYDNPKQGCWVNGQTVYGNVYIGNQNWGTYTRPVFAYLVLADTVSFPQNVEKTHQFNITKGHTLAFETSVSTKYSVGASIDIVNISSDIEIGFKTTEAWSTTTSDTRSTTIKGPGTFMTYQIFLVYAHNATSAANKFPNAFQFSKASDLIDGWRRDLYYLSAIAQDKWVTVRSEKSIKPLNWTEVQQLVLMQNYDVRSNSGEFGFDWSAYNDPHRRY